jgi:hypothetical protein
VDYIADWASQALHAAAADPAAMRNKDGMLLGESPASLRRDAPLLQCADIIANDTEYVEKWLEWRKGREAASQFRSGRDMLLHEAIRCRDSIVTVDAIGRLGDVARRFARELRVLADDIEKPAGEAVGPVEEMLVSSQMLSPIPPG